MDDTGKLLDCAIVGAGPAGLTAALYLRRFHRDIVVFDSGNSRARWIPTSHNCPGFPGGVSGDDLLARLREQGWQYGIDPVATTVTKLERDDAGFVLSDATRNWRARTVLLATGIVDVLPDVPWIDAAVERLAIRLCPICDAYEATGDAIATFGPIDDAIDHALFLRTYSQRIVAAGTDGTSAGDAARGKATDAGITVLPGACIVDYDDGRCSLMDGDGQRHAFDAVYPVMGARAQSMLAVAVGAEVDDAGDLLCGKDQMTSISGLYAAGDVVSALNQIAVATGHAAIAASAIHNALPQRMAGADPG